MSVKLRTKELVNKGKSYYLDIYHQGTRQYEFLQIVTHKDDKPDQKKEKLELANAIRSQREIELITLGTAYTPKHRQKVDFIEYYKEFLKNYTKRDVRMIRYSFEKFMLFLESENLIKPNKPTLKASQVTKRLCEDYRDFLCSEQSGLKGETPQNYFARFKKVLKQATRDNLFKQYPALDIIFKKSTDNSRLKKSILTAPELRLLVNTYCGNDEVKRAFLFACFTGLGMAELKVLTWANVDNNRLITAREKTNISVNILLSDSAVKLLGAKGKASDKIFNLSISDQAVSKNLKEWVLRAGIEKEISFYCGRHTYAVLLLMNGTNLKTVSEAMGQTSTKHTVKYLNYIDSLKDEATSKLPNLF